MIEEKCARRAARDHVRHAAYRAAHLEEERARQRAYEAEPERRAKRLFTQRAYATAHREEKAAYMRTYYAANRDGMSAKNRAYRETHSGERSAYMRGWHLAHYTGQTRIETYVVYAGPLVVYVGRTDHFEARQRNHRVRSPWFDEMTDIHHRYHASYADSLVDEALLIRLYQPKYNQLGVTR
jgi:hypothetical protein